MSDVKRFACANTGYPYEVEDGEFVHFEDYNSILYRLDTLTVERDQAKYGEQDMENQRDSALLRLNEAHQLLGVYQTQRDSAESRLGRIKAVAERSYLLDESYHSGIEEILEILEQASAVERHALTPLEKLVNESNRIVGAKVSE